MAADKIIWIHVLTTEKEFMKVAAYEGESLQKALTRGQVPGFPASCQGGDPESTSHERPFDYYSRGPTWSQCQIYMKQEFSGRISKLNQEVEYLDEIQEIVQSDSRLACCIPVKTWMNGMPIEIGWNGDLQAEDLS